MSQRKHQSLRKLAHRANSKYQLQVFLGWTILSAALIVIGIVIGNFFFGGEKNPLRDKKIRQITHVNSLAVKGKNADTSISNTPVKYDFYNELKKRSDEVSVEVQKRIVQKQGIRVEGRNYRIQIGAFRDKASAEQLRDRMILRNYPTNIIQNIDMQLVQIGPYVDRDEAIKIQKKLEREGLKTVLKAYVN